MYKFIKNFCLIVFLLTGCSERITDMQGLEQFTFDSQIIDENNCATYEMYSHKTEKLNPKLLKENKELVQEEDILDVEIYHPSRHDLVSEMNNISQSKGFEIRDGMIFLPNLDYVEVVNLTLKETKEKIQKRYQKELKDIEVFVSFKKRKIKKIEIIGVDNKEIQIGSNTRLFDVLAKVNSLSCVNLFKSYVLRKNKLLPVDFYNLIKKADMSQNIVMKDNDKIFLADGSDCKVYVLGEVQRPLAIEMPKGKISLKEVISQAGLLHTVNKTYIQIFRANVQNPKIYLLNWDYICRLPSSSLNLIEGDIVYVASTPIANWNKFAVQILPTISIIDSANRGFKNIGIFINGK